MLIKILSAIFQTTAYGFAIECPLMMVPAIMGFGRPRFYGVSTSPSRLEGAISRIKGRLFFVNSSSIL